MQIRLIDRYKVELQEMAGEVKSMRVSEAEQLLESQMQMSNQREDFQVKKKKYLGMNGGLNNEEIWQFIRSFVFYIWNLGNVQRREGKVT